MTAKEARRQKLIDDVIARAQHAKLDPTPGGLVNLVADIVILLAEEARADGV